MKKTRFTAALLSAAMMCSTAAALPASAVSTISDFSPSAYAGFTELDRELGMIDGSNVYDFIAMRYLKVDENKSVTEVELSEYPDNITFFVDGDINSAGIMQRGSADRIVNADAGYVLVKGSVQKDGRTAYTVYLRSDGGNSIYGKMSAKDLAYVYDAFSAQGAADFRYTFGFYYTDHSYAPYMTAFSSRYAAAVQAYIEGNDIDAQIVQYKAGDTDFAGKEVTQDLIYVIPDTELSDIEHYRLAQDISVNAGVRPEFVSPAMMSVGIEATDYIPGDANCGGTADIADAVLIQQHLANPEKYSLSDAGLINGDIAGNCDGITGLDALAVQKLEAGSAF